METRIRTLGEATTPSPLTQTRFMSDAVRVLVDPHVIDSGGTARPVSPADALEQAGPRATLFFAPGRTRCAVLTAGGLCPGLNDVVRGIVLELHYRYGVATVLGLRYGFDGLTATGRLAARELAPSDVADLHGRGGTLLGTCRGRHDAAELCDSLAALDVDVLFCVGGDGTLRGAAAIARELARRGEPRAVVGVPKTIDNDILHCSRTFGFLTAVEEAARCIAGAHAEATAHDCGVGLVKLMGRESGFIAASASLACPDVNFCLIPELAFRLEGAGGLFDALSARLQRKRHAVIVVAEGAGRDLVPAGRAVTDASGNVKPPDVGTWLRDVITEHFRARGLPLTLKYIDPSYTIRSRGANAVDATFCGHLAKMAVHAGMAGKTELMIGLWNDMFVHVPLQEAVAGRKRVKPSGLLWQSVLATTGQPDLS